MENTVAELVFIPAPGVGHIMSTIEMAKVLVNRQQSLSINVLLMNPPYPNSALTTYIESLAKNTIERIRFTRLPHDQTPPRFDPKAFLLSFYEYINSHYKHVRNIVTDMTNQHRVVGFVVDVFCTRMIDVANEFNVPAYVFFTSNVAYLGFNLYIETLCVDFMTCSFRELRKAKGIMVNTFFATDFIPLSDETTSTDGQPTYFNKMTREKPFNDNIWLEFAEFQDKVESRQPQRGARLQMLEKKISILEKAAELNPDNAYQRRDIHISKL